MIQRIKIDGTVYEIENLFLGSYLPLIEVAGQEFYLAESEYSAGEAAKDYWRDMRKHDPQEFRCLIGDETLIAWACGESAGPGSTKVNSFEEWLEVVAGVPEEQWASYDGNPSNVTRVGRLREDLGFTPTVAYRHN